MGEQIGNITLTKRMSQPTEVKQLILAGSWVTHKHIIDDANLIMINDVRSFFFFTECYCRWRGSETYFFRCTTNTSQPQIRGVIQNGWTFFCALRLAFLVSVCDRMMYGNQKLLRGTMRNTRILGLPKLSSHLPKPERGATGNIIRSFTKFGNCQTEIMFGTRGFNDEEESDPTSADDGVFLSDGELHEWHRSMQVKMPQVFTADDKLFGDIGSQHPIGTRLMAWFDDDPNKPMRMEVRGSRWVIEFGEKSPMYLVRPRNSDELTQIALS